MTVGIVLAGGRSSRMGSDKALIHVGGVTMIQHVAAALSSVCEQVVVVGRKTGPVPDALYLPDLGTAYKGPLGGIVTAMRKMDADVLVVAVDQPGVRPTTLRNLLDLAGPHPVIPEADGWLQVTCAWYPKTLLPILAKELTLGGSLHSALQGQEIRKVPKEEWETWGEKGDSWRSLDTPEQLDDFDAK